MEFLKFSWSQLQQLVGARYCAMCTPSVYFGSQHEQISPGADDLLGNIQGHCKLPLPWLHSDLFPPLCVGSAYRVQLHASWCMETKAASKKGQQSSGTCPAPISPPDRRRRCLFIAQVRVTRSNVNKEHGYCLLLPRAQKYVIICRTTVQICNTDNPLLHNYNIITMSEMRIINTWCIIICNNSKLQPHVFTKFWCVDLLEYQPTHQKRLKNHTYAWS